MHTTHFNASSLKLKAVAGAVALALAIPSTNASAAVILAGNATENIASALNQLGVTYTLGGSMPSSLSASDTLILATDGLGGTYVNYTSALNAGADIIVIGGAAGSSWSDWVGQYINNVGNTGWHTDGKWTTLVSNAATQYMPAVYTPQDNALTFHMTHLSATTDTVMLGKNDENNNIAAFRTYANGGSFNYLAMDAGRYGSLSDIANFTKPYLRGALQAAQFGLVAAPIPEPSSLALFGVGMLCLAVSRRKPA